MSHIFMQAWTFKSIANEKIKEKNNSRKWEHGHNEPWLPHTNMRFTSRNAAKKQRSYKKHIDMASSTSNLKTLTNYIFPTQCQRKELLNL